MSEKNAIYAQSGGVTAVINATACGVIKTARLHTDRINKLYAARNGIIGVLAEQLFDTSLESEQDLNKLMYTPAGAFGSCRYKLKDHSVDYERLLAVFKAHNIHYFFYNGGGDSQDTAYKIARLGSERDFPITCIGIPKTVDNDLPFTDNCPGFGSVAKYIAISTLEAGFDVASMASSSTKVFILEVMGRHTGWIAAASGLAGQTKAEPPHIILFPEIAFEPQKFLAAVKNCVRNYGFSVIVVSEGLRNVAGTFLATDGLTDSFGHAQLGGVAPLIAQLVKKELGYKNHWAIADYLQRAARHIASAVDVEQAYALGQAAVNLALQGHNAIMPVIKRECDSPYLWTISHVDLAKVANQEKKMPKEFISADGFSITEACRGYLAPLIHGEAYPPFQHGLPTYGRLRNQLVKQKLTVYEPIATVY